MLKLFNSSRQSDAYQVSQDANRSANGGLKSHQLYRASDNRPLTPAELRQIQQASQARKVRNG